ncbi:MAG: SLATT domain-containing protein [Pseudobdellovibrionaceae bacterium]|nr:SLATT domain-containing protein [Pseudobdellovibrionaceae bacterium]
MGKDIESGEYSEKLSSKENAIKYLSDFIEESLSWYKSHRSGKKFWSKGLRFAAIIFMSAGTLISLLPTTLIEDWHRLALERSLPGIFVAMAGLCLTLDKAYGHTSGWKRYMETIMLLQKEKDNFHYLRCEMEPKMNDAEFIGACRKIMLRVRGIVAKEVADWAHELSYQQRTQAQQASENPNEGKVAS